MALIAMLQVQTCVSREDGILELGAKMEGFLGEVETRAFRIALVSTRDADEALDIVQDAMISLTRSYADRSIDEWRPLFYRILKNRIYDWQRKNIVRARVMSFFSGQESNVAETATAMGCSDGSVKKHYSRAVHRLREMIGEHI